MKLGKISSLALNRMKRRGISIATLRYLLAHGRVDRNMDGARLVWIDCPAPRAGTQPQATLYAVLDAEGEVITVERRIRRGCIPGPAASPSALS